MKRWIAFVLSFCVLFCGLSIVRVRANDFASELTSRSAILIEASTGKVLFEKDADVPLPMASVTKIMTMLLIMEAVDGGRISLDDMVTGSARAKSMGGSTIFLDAGEQLSVHDMLKGIAVASANDACVAMAEHIAGTEAGFVSMMNTRAGELGMKNTVFKNTNGLDAPGHYSSARDIAIMSAELLKHPKILDYTTIWMDSLRDGKFQLANTNKLIRFYKGAIGLKTGSTDDALYCLSGAAERDGMRLIAVVLAAPSSPKRFAETTSLLDYGFAVYGKKQLVKREEVIGTVPVEKGLSDKVCAVAAEDYIYVGKKGEAEQLRVETELFQSVQAPVEKGEKLGEALIYDGETPVHTVELRAAESVKRLSYKNVFTMLLRNWLACIK